MRFRTSKPSVLKIIAQFEYGMTEKGSVSVPNSQPSGHHSFPKNVVSQIGFERIEREWQGLGKSNKKFSEIDKLPKGKETRLLLVEPPKFGA
jgi:hypothetical protein